MSLEHEYAVRASARANEALNKAFQIEQQLIKYRASHRSLLAHLRMAAKDLQKTHPIMSARYLDVATDWEKFCEKPQQSFGEVASDQTSDTGSSGPTGSAQAQAPSGAAQGVCYLDLPAAVRQQQWDSIAATAGLK